MFSVGSSGKRGGVRSSQLNTISVLGLFLQHLLLKPSVYRMTPALSFNNETTPASIVIRNLLLLKLHNGNSQPRVPIMEPILPLCVFVHLFSPLCHLTGQACLSSVRYQPESRPEQGLISCCFVFVYKYIRIQLCFLPDTYMMEGDQ